MSINIRDCAIRDGRYVVDAICRDCRSWNTGSIDFNSTSQAMDEIRLNRDEKDAGLRRHDHWGKFKIDLVAARGDPSLFPPKDLSMANVTDHEEHNDHKWSSLVHRVMMIGTFAAIFPIGVFYKRLLGNIRWHYYIQVVGLLIVIGGSGLGIALSRYYERWISEHIDRSVEKPCPHFRSTMNGPSGTFSPVSANGSEWSGIGRYQNLEPSNYSSQPPHPRGNLATPPISGSSAGIQGRLSNGMNRPPNAPGNPSPPSSIARSSYGTSLSDHHRRKTLMMEETLSQHYTILRRYLASSLRDEKGNVKQNRARDKLLRLSPVQFQELSTDVYDELLRRQSAAGQQTSGPGQVPSYLLPKNNFHPKRNQARSKLSSLPPPRFRDLATDVFYELERRFPRFIGAEIGRNGSPAPSIRGPPSRVGTPNGTRPGSRGQGPPGPGQGPGYGYGPPRNASLGSQVMAGLGIPGVGGPDDAYGRPTAKTFQSSTIIPNKSTLVEDDDDQTGPEDNDDGRSEFSRRRRDTGNTQRSVGVMNERDKRAIADFEAQINDLQGKVGRLETTVKDRDFEIHDLRQAQDEKDQANREWVNLRNNLETKLAEAQKLNKNLQTELERVKSDQTATERQLRSELDQMSRRGDGSESEWKTRYEGLNKAHSDLQNEMKQQQVTTREVKQEAAGFLNEMKVLSERSNQTYEREESLVRQNHRLEEQVDEWKSRYARAKAQLRTLRTSSVPFQQADVGQIAKDGDLIQQHGLVQDINVTRFQVAVDELLRNARTSGAESVLPSLRQVVVAVRQISQDIGEPSKDETGQQISKLKAKMSATANNLITASKNFAASKGLSPVSVLDAATSHLTTAVVELIRLVKIHPSPVRELDAEEEDNSVIAESPAAYYGIQQDRMSYGGESIYSSPSSPRPRNAFNDPAKMKHSYHRRNLSSRDAAMNGVKAPSQTKLGFGIREQEDELEELKASLENDTEGLVESIQLLHACIRDDSNPATVRGRLDGIATIVGKMVSDTQHTIESTRDSKLYDQTGPGVSMLANSWAKVTEASVRCGEIHDMQTWSKFKETVPPLAFAVARETENLVQRLDQLDGGRMRE
ncbi:MAG: hypothetical protein Q9188_000178 [Gyalolechia gomerana]